MTKSILYIATGLIVLAIVLFFMGQNTFAPLALIIGFGLLAYCFNQMPGFKSYVFTVGILAAVTVSMSYPQYFLGIGDFSFKKLIVPLLQIIMLGMGTTMSFKDFTDVVKMPKAVGVGLLAQFIIMPLTGFILTRVFNFEPEIAAGIILIGCCPSGLASNVMSYIAGANVALSITLTSIATLLAPVLTPFLMKNLAGAMVPVDFWAMLIDICKMILIPVILGFAINHFLSSRITWLNKVMPLVSMLAIGLIIIVITANGRDNLLKVGGLLILACFLHNTIGYFVGYLFAKASGLDKRSCRTVAIEVGLQNAGLASGLALSMGKVATVGLASAIFGPLMNMTGSMLASYWKERPV
jgi:bile acid:Na+ symporter, BASS family